MVLPMKDGDGILAHEWLRVTSKRSSVPLLLELILEEEPFSETEGAGTLFLIDWRIAGKSEGRPRLDWSGEAGLCQPIFCFRRRAPVVLSLSGRARG